MRAYSPRVKESRRILTIQDLAKILGLQALTQYGEFRGTDAWVPESRRFGESDSDSESDAVCEKQALLSYLKAKMQSPRVSQG